jgi:hypothetical protein
MIHDITAKVAFMTVNIIKKKRPAHIYLDEHIHQELRVRSKDLCMTKSAWIVQAILEKIHRENRANR